MVWAFSIPTSKIIIHCLRSRPPKTNSWKPKIWANCYKSFNLNVSAILGRIPLLNLTKLPFGVTNRRELVAINCLEWWFGKWFSFFRKESKKLKFQPESFRGVNCSFWPTSFFGGILKTITLRNPNLHIKVIEFIQHHSKVMKKKSNPNKMHNLLREFPENLPIQFGCIVLISAQNKIQRNYLCILWLVNQPPPGHVPPPNTTALLRAS